jgi:cysteine desulfurase
MMNGEKSNRIYLDNAATTCIDERVIDAMLPFYYDVFGNPSSLHRTGTSSKSVLENSREVIAGTIGASPSEIIFTGSGTEANNLALKGIAFGNRQRGNHLIVSAIEHDCILNTCSWLEEQGFSVAYLPVDETGVIDMGQFLDSITPKTILASVMFANNEIGTLEPVSAIGRVCKERGILFHTDACQAFGKIPIDVEKENISLMTINSHKIYGPKGVGALYSRNGVKIEPILHGGGQEKGLRSSTENVPAIAGFAEAAKLCMNEMEQEAVRQRTLRNNLIRRLSEQYESFYINGDPGNCLPGYLNFSFHGLEGEAIRLLLELDEKGISVSAGSACSSNQVNHNASHVLRAIGRNPFEARGAIRVSIGRFNHGNDIDVFTAALGETIGSMKAIFSSR